MSEVFTTSQQESCKKLSLIERAKQKFDDACTKVQSNTKHALGAILLGSSLALAPNAQASTPAVGGEALVSSSINFQSPELKPVLDTLDVPVQKELVEAVGYAEALKKTGVLASNMILKVEPLIIGKDRAQDLSYIENNLALAPLKPTKEVVGEGFSGFDIKNNEAGYVALVEKLFNPSEVSKWYRIGEEKREPTAEELAEFVKKLEDTKKRWLSVQKRWDYGINKGDLKKEVYADFSKMFSQDIAKMPEISTEAARLLFVTIGSMAYNQNLTDTESAKKIKDSQVINMSTNVSWKAILTNTGVPQVSFVKISIGSEKITLVGSGELKKVSGVEKFTQVGLQAAAKIRENIQFEIESQQRKALIASEQKKIQELDQKIAAADQKIAAADQKIAENKQIIAQASQKLEVLTTQIAGSDKKIMELDTIKSIGSESHMLSLSVIDDVQKMLASPNDVQILETMKGKLEKLKENRKKVEALLQVSQNETVISTAKVIITMIDSAQNQLQIVQLG